MTKPLEPTIAQAIIDALAPDVVTTVSEWADTYRMLDSRSAKPGKWETLPYQREPMDRLSRMDPCQLLWLMWASQLGKSDIFNNAIGCHIHQSPRPMMMVQPTIDTVEDYHSERIEPMIGLCPELADIVPPLARRNGGQKLKLRRFRGGQLYFSGSNSAASLASKPVGDLYCDEVDRFDDDVDGEGDSFDVVRKRTTTFPDRKVAASSTPTVRGESRIEAGFNESDRRYYWVPCPDCEQYQRLVWRDATGHRLKWTPGKPHEADYQCDHCGSLIPEGKKLWMLERGEWRPECPENDDDGRVRGYHLNALYSPMLTWAELAKEWEEAKGNREKLKTFINTRVAETWEDEGGMVFAGEGLLERREPYTVIPAMVAVLTIGVDIQRDRLEVFLWGWGAGEECWLVDHVVIPGDTTQMSTWRKLDPYRERVRHTADGRKLIAQATCIDSGDGETTQAAYEYCAERVAANVWPIKGASSDKAVVWPNAPTRIKDKRTKKFKVKLYIVGVSKAKVALYRRLAQKTPGPGYIHLPMSVPSGREIDLAWVNQLTAEERKGTRKGGERRVRWHLPSGRRNEALDGWVYAYAGLQGLIRAGLKLPDEVDPNLRIAAAPKKSKPKKKKQPAKAPEEAPPAAPRRPPRKDWLRAPRPNWLRRT